jgi:hypothetical protein
MTNTKFLTNGFIFLFVGLFILDLYNFTSRSYMFILQIEQEIINLI